MKIICCILLINIMSFAQKISEKDARWEFNIESMKKTTITVLNADSLVIYTVFDNKLAESHCLWLIKQPTFYKTNKNNNNIIYVPLPKLENGKYLIRYSSTDSTYTSKFYYIE